jgi:hypothetical protein
VTARLDDPKGRWGRLVKRWQRGAYARGDDGHVVETAAEGGLRTIFV